MRVADEPNDPSRWMLHDEFVTTPAVFQAGCYICEDSEYAQMGLPLCYACPNCDNPHVPADDGCECEDV